MISAFGVEHGEVSKSLKPQHIAALKRTAADRSLIPFSRFRNSMYAESRLRNHGIQAAGKDIAPRMTLSRGMGNSTMKRMTRTRRPTRDANRKKMFGNEVAKSFVNGKWVKAAEATPKQLSHIARGGQYKAAHGLQPRDIAWKEQRAEQHKIMSGALSHKGKNNPDVTPGSAGTYRVGGKSSGQSFIISNLPKEAVPKKIRRSVMGHEAVHAAPKRSSYRLHNQILGNPKKMMREEARADYISGGHFSQHPDQGSLYAQAARASHGIKTAGPKSTYKFQPKTKKAFKAGGMDVPKVSNRDALTNVKTNIQTIFPHYKLGGKKGDKAIGSYRKLQNKLQAKGVQGGRSL